MTNGVALGIDCGDRLLRAVYVDGSRALSLALPHEAQEPVIFFDPMANISSLGVGFPSVLQKVGGEHSLRFPPNGQTADDLVARRLGRVREMLLEATANQPGETFLAVPAALGQSRRNALLECAQTAGLDRVSLIDKCTAAALAYHASQEKPTTALVFDLGYGDCEYSLVRLAKGHCRVVTSGSVPKTSGEMLDAVLMEGIVLALRKRRLFLGLKQWTAEEWSVFRRLAESARLTLAVSPETIVTLPPRLSSLDRSLRMRLYRDGFARTISPLVAKTIESVQDALAQNELELADIDAFLLIGRVADDPPVWSMLRQVFKDKPRRTDPDLVAAGAAWQAYQQMHGAPSENTPVLSLKDLLTTRDAPPIDEEQSCPLSDREGDAEFVQVLDFEESAQALPAVPADNISLAAVRALRAEGKHLEAATVLDAVLQEANALKAELAKDVLSGPRQTLQQAQSLLNAGEFFAAVDLSHRAYEQDPDDPVVFESMMKIHAEAGLRLDRPEEYNAALRILNCAHSHDQTDATIHKALGERHYRHAVALRNLNNTAKAIEAAHSALSFDPKHSGANDLLRQLASEQPS